MNKKAVKMGGFYGIIHIVIDSYFKYNEKSLNVIFIV